VSRSTPAERPLPVLLPAAMLASRDGRREGWSGVPRLRLEASHGVALLVLFAVACGVAEAQGAAGKPSIVETIWKWTPLLARGFLFNLAISFLAMAGGTVAGFFLGFAQISLLPPVRKAGWLVTNFFRNAPWLVLLFYCMFLLPFRITVLGVTIPIPDWTKATFGLALPVMANVSEIVRGAVQSLPTTQWEAASSLAFNRRQSLWMIIVPQCIKRMLPPWMNLYAILTMSTVLASIVGVNEMMTLTQRALSAESRA
jgi:polar amino acid transport system permease protein